MMKKVEESMYAVGAIGHNSTEYLNVYANNKDYKNYKLPIAVVKITTDYPRNRGLETVLCDAIRKCINTSIIEIRGLK